MKRVIFYFIVLLLAIWLGLKIQADSGYVLVVYKDWSMETTLWFAALSLLLIYFVAYGTTRLFKKGAALPNKMKNWSSTRKHDKAQCLTTEGVCLLAEGKWDHAEKTLQKAAEKSEIPIVNYIAAARAAQAQGRYNERDNYLEQASTLDMHSNTAVKLLQAQMQIEAGQLDAAIINLNALHKELPSHSQVLAFLATAYQHIGDYASTISLLPDLRKHKAYKRDDIVQIEQNAYLGLLRNSFENLDGLQTTWKKMPKKLHEQPEHVLVYAKGLVHHQQPDEALKVLTTAIGKHWDDRLVELYGQIEASKPDKQLSKAEAWMQAHADSAALFRALGRIAIRNQLWGKAKANLETSLNIAPNPATYHVLAYLAEQQGDKDLALEYYKKA